MKKPYLFTPGPTPIPTEALLAMAQPVDYHRSAEATAIFADVSEKLRTVLQTENDVLVLTSSGTGAMESAVANLLSPEDKVLVIRSGKFGERWGEICAAYGIAFDSIDLEWGQSIDPQLVADKLAQDPGIKVVFSTLCETSTGVVHDIQSLGAITRETPTLLLVDGISGLGADDLQMDVWGVDGVVSGSQKGLMTPPGLGIVSLSERGWQAVATSRLPKFYLDLAKARKALAKPTTPYTPAMTLIIALQQALKLICDEGIRNVIARHARLAGATRAAVKSLGLQLFAQSPANTVTAVRFPEDLDTQAFNKMMREEHGITYAGGQDRLKGEIIRIGHLGWANEYDVIIAIAALELGLRESGYPVALGAGTSAVQEYFAQ